MNNETNKLMFVQQYWYCLSKIPKTKAQNKTTNSINVYLECMVTYDCTTLPDNMFVLTIYLLRYLSGYLFNIRDNVSVLPVIYRCVLVSDSNLLSWYGLLISLTM